MAENETTLKEDTLIADTTTTKVSASQAASEYWKKAGCAVTGGVITAVGLVMIPAPTPCGCIVTAYGLSVLGREFEGAQRIVEGAKGKLEGGLEAWASDWERDEEADSDNTNTDGKECESKEEKEVTQQTDYETDEDIEQEQSDISEGYQMLSQEECEEETEKEMAVVHMNEAERSRQEQIVLEKRKQQVNSTTELNQSPFDAWGKAWKSHTTNFRKGTSSFISTTLLPALKDLDLTHKKAREATNDSNSEENEEAVVQIGDGEVIKLSQREIDMIQEEIKSETPQDSTPSTTTDSSLVPDSTESMASETSSDEASVTSNTL